MNNDRPLFQLIFTVTKLIKSYMLTEYEKYRQRKHVVYLYEQLVKHFMRKYGTFFSLNDFVYTFPN